MATLCGEKPCKVPKVPRRELRVVEEVIYSCIYPICHLMVTQPY